MLSTSSLAYKFDDSAPTPSSDYSFSYKWDERTPAPHQSMWGNGMKVAFPKRGTNVVQPASNREIAKGFSAQIIHLPTKVVAEQTNRTTEAVKKWRVAEVAPDTASVINAARGIPEVKSWLWREIDPEFPEGLMSDRTLSQLFGFLGNLASGADETAMKARSLLQAIHGINARGRIGQ